MQSLRPEVHRREALERAGSTLVVPTLVAVPSRPAMEFESIEAFYRAAHIGLRVLDNRGVRRRFGAEADARWVQFRGDMTEADRFDLLLRDAATQAPLAFAPREVFVLEGLSLEDPFGAAWKGPPRGLAGALSRSEAPTPDDPTAAFDEAVAQWRVSPPRLDDSTLPRIVASTRLVVGGLGMLRALVARFAAHRGSFDLADQVLFVADQPVERQLFGLATVFLATPGVGRVVQPKATIDTVRALVRAPFDLQLVSADASDAVRGTVAALADALGH